MEEEETGSGVFSSIRFIGKVEDLLSWPFLGEIPETTRVGDR